MCSVEVSGAPQNSSGIKCRQKNTLYIFPTSWHSGLVPKYDQNISESVGVKENINIFWKFQYLKRVNHEPEKRTCFEVALYTFGR